MASEYNRWERFYHRLNLIFNGIVAFTLIPFAFAFLETKTEFPDPPILQGQTGMIFKVALIVISAVVIGYAQIFGKRSLLKIHKLEGIDVRLKAYLKEKIKGFALLEGAAVMACVGLYVTKDHIFTFVYVFVLFIFSLARPTFDRVAREVKVSEKDLKEWGESA